VTHVISAHAVREKPCCSCQSPVFSEQQIVLIRPYVNEVKVRGGRQRKITGDTHTHTDANTPHRDANAFIHTNTDRHTYIHTYIYYTIYLYYFTDRISIYLSPTYLAAVIAGP
jgi:hypothetical protein